METEENSATVAMLDPYLISMIPIEAREALRKLASAWSDVADPEALEVVLFKGAGQMAVNKVFEIRWKSDNLRDRENEKALYRKVLLRIYGEGTESFTDREDEIGVFEAVSRQGQGPRLLERFTNGRVEEFINGRDYELACFNPAAFDIAIYFCEMGADFNTEASCIWDYNKYPNLDERKRFVQIYLNASAGEDPKDAEVETLLENIEKYVLVSHLYCALGPLTLGHTDSICKEYVTEKLRQYWLTKHRTWVE